MFRRVIDEFAENYKPRKVIRISFVKSSIFCQLYDSDMPIEGGILKVFIILLNFKIIV